MTKFKNTNDKTMKNKDTLDHIDDIAQDASVWFFRLQDQEPSEKLFLEWQAWLAESDTNAAAFAEVEACWTALDEVRETSMTNKTQVNRTGHSRIWAYAGAMAASVALLVSAALFTIYGDGSDVPTATYQTALSEHKTITLEDGSKITLGARSIVNVNYTEAQRQLTLVRGEAIFDVAKNKARPFIVQVGKGAVTAVGTKFNIHATERDVTVTVLEGTVEVTPLMQMASNTRARLPRVTVGETMSYAQDGTMTDVTPANVDAVTSWEQGLLVRVDTALSSVIADVNRYSSREIIIGDPELKDIKFTGTVLNNGVDDWLQGLSLAYPIKIVDTGHDAILLLKKDE
ncbi:FecR family protein [Paremcibacter congregatus]|uniref:FecR family protein n=1 Tax=Paremcibacter congregatus TaxID=2043170 RepID=UPI003A959B28